MKPLKGGNYPNGNPVGTVATIEGASKLKATADGWQKYSDVGVTQEAQTWVRNPEWLPMPAVDPSESKIVCLVEILKGEKNTRGIMAKGDYLVDWGDGTNVELNASGQTSFHDYDFEAFDLENATLMSNGSKQVLVTLTPQPGQLLTEIWLNGGANYAGRAAYGEHLWQLLDRQ